MFKKLAVLSVTAALMAAMLVPTVASAHPAGIGDGTVDGSVLNGQHYNLNIIGVKNDKVNMDEIAGGHVIFVDLNGKSKINLVEGDDFAVLDKNGTDNDGATFQLPDPGLDPYVVGDEGDADTITNYSIFVRALGSPQGEPYAKITTCAEVNESNLMTFLDKDQIEIINEASELDPDAVVSIESTGQLLREKGQSIFTNQTAALLTIVLQVSVTYDDGGTMVTETMYVRVPIFDDILENEFWEYDNHGLKLLQVRIYRVATDVSEADWSDNWSPIALPS